MVLIYPDALRAVADAYTAASLPLPKRLAHEAGALLREQIRKARGLPSLPR